ncbi:hypothetical protein Q7C36_009848 [Tachysurus vachellii]|uniref:Uncharacterized protein n=1 Tax=Tachysurus vachellii TaxID=175792 RepID=A0AA88N4G8_TACVA|nr:hypothetical protein Q7C36_009848 [Tachysurus vachellii]
MSHSFSEGTSGPMKTDNTIVVSYINRQGHTLPSAASVGKEADCDTLSLNPSWPSEILRNAEMNNGHLNNHPR